MRHVQSAPTNLDNPREAGIHRWAVKDSTWNPLIESDPERIFMDYADVKLGDLYTWH